MDFTSSHSFREEEDGDAMEVISSPTPHTLSRKKPIFPTSSTTVSHAASVLLTSDLFWCIALETVPRDLRSLCSTCRGLYKLYKLYHERIVRWWLYYSSGPKVTSNKSAAEEKIVQKSILQSHNKWFLNNWPCGGTFPALEVFHSALLFETESKSTESEASATENPFVCPSSLIKPHQFLEKHCEFQRNLSISRYSTSASYHHLMLDSFDGQSFFERTTIVPLILHFLDADISNASVNFCQGFPWNIGQIIFFSTVESTPWFLFEFCENSLLKEKLYGLAIFQASRVALVVSSALVSLVNSSHTSADIRLRLIFHRIMKPRMQPADYCHLLHPINADCVDSRFWDLAETWQPQTIVTLVRPEEDTDSWLKSLEMGSLISCAMEDIYFFYYREDYCYVGECDIFLLCSIVGGLYGLVWVRPNQNIQDILQQQALFTEQCFGFASPTLLNGLEDYNVTFYVSGQMEDVVSKLPKRMEEVLKRSQKIQNKVVMEMQNLDLNMSDYASFL